MMSLLYLHSSVSFCGCVIFVYVCVSILSGTLPIGSVKVPVHPAEHVVRVDGWIMCERRIWADYLAGMHFFMELLAPSPCLPYRRLR